MGIQVNQVEAHKSLAAAVLINAIQEATARDKLQRAWARSFLTAPNRMADRALWLAWMGFTDDEFQCLIKRRNWQGLKSKLALGGSNAS